MGRAVEFDLDFVEDVMLRLETLRPDSAPLWGALSPEGMKSHLIVSLRYAMGQYGASPQSGNWFTRMVLGRLILWGVVPFPRNVRLPFPSREGEAPPGDLESLHAVLEEYLELVQAGALAPPPHPVFGDLGIDGWARFHVQHFDHHLKQFDL